METLTVQFKKGTLYSRIVAILLCLWGSKYLLGGLTKVGFGFEISAYFILNCSLGLLFFGSGIYSYFWGSRIEISANKDFFRSTKNNLIRTVYWNEVGRIVLSRYNIRFNYENGAYERFRLPYLSEKEFENMNAYLAGISKSRYIQFSGKPRWYLFWFSK